MQKTKFHSLGGFVQSHPLAVLVAASAAVLFLCSSYRHFFFHSEAFDLGIFDQAIYLISQGLPPISSFLRFHILGDHASVIFYPIALLYKIYPSVYWLFAVQAIGLALGALPTYHLARLAGIERAMALMLAAAYLLYPVVFNVNLYDFHPDVLAPAAILGAVWAARTDRIIWFSLLVLLVLSLKAPLALTVVAMGIWLALFEKKPKYGLIAIAAGVLWFLFITQWLLPLLSGTPSRGLRRYTEFGNSPLEIALNLFLKPNLVAGALFTQQNLIYLGKVFLPVAWGLSPLFCAPLVGALPTLIMNLMADFPGQKAIARQYSVPIVPFLFLAMIATVAANQHWLNYLTLKFSRLKTRWLILAWAILSFTLLTHYGLLARLPNTPRTVAALQQAIDRIDSAGSVLTDSRIAPHLTHRPQVQLTCGSDNPLKAAQWDYILLNTRNPARRRGECIPELAEQLLVEPAYHLDYKKRGIYLFTRK